MNPQDQDHPAQVSGEASTPVPPRFANTYCSQCGEDLGPGDAGVSRCSDHGAELGFDFTGDQRRSAGIAMNEQRGLMHPATQVFFRAGLLACREYMARFVESESPAIAASIRANWWPKLGQDYGPPRQLDWNELTDGEYGESTFRCKDGSEVSPTQEALPIALRFLESA